MSIDRRAFLTHATAALGWLSGAPDGAEVSRSDTLHRGRPKAVAFDGFPIIDPRPIAAKAEELFPGKGAALTAAWRTRQFEYTWLRTLSGHYVDFWQTTQEALIYAAASVGIALTGQSRQQLMNSYLELRAWPDARPALEALRGAGVRLVFLSNFTAQMLDAVVENSGLKGFFETHLSTDRVRAYKPHPSAYAMALQAFNATRDDIVFCASAGWDAAGAKWFVYRTFWLNRLQLPGEELGVTPDGSGTSLADFASFVLR